MISMSHHCPADQCSNLWRHYREENYRNTISSAFASPSVTSYWVAFSSATSYWATSSFVATAIADTAAFGCR